MYLEALENWTGKDWGAFFEQYPLVNSIEKKDEVKQILTLSSKEAIEGYFSILRKYWIINWVWPWYLSWTFRKILTKFFKYVKSEWHDITYWIGGVEADRIKADIWLLQYSLLSINASDLNFFIRWFWVFTAFFCFFMVYAFGRFWSFRYL